MAVNMFAVLCVVMIQNIATGTATIMDQSLRMIMVNRTRSEKMMMNNTNTTAVTLMPITPPNLWEPHYEPGDTFIKERVTQSSAESDSEVKETTATPVLNKKATQSPFSYLGQKTPNKGLIPEAYYEITESPLHGAQSGKESTRIVLTDSSDPESPKKSQEEAETNNKVQTDISDSEKPNTRPEFSKAEINKNFQPVLSVYENPKQQVNEKSKMPPYNERAQLKLSNLEKPKPSEDFTTPVVDINSHALDSDNPNFRKNEIPTPEPVSQNEPPQVVETYQRKISKNEPQVRGCHSIPKNVDKDKDKTKEKNDWSKKMNETRFSEISGKFKKYLDSWAFKVHNFYKA